MSFNQSRSDKSDSQYRKSGRSAAFNQPRTSSGAYGKGGGAGPAPSPSLSSNRSFKKSNNAQGGQSRLNVPAVNSSDSANAPAHRNVQNGAHPPLHGASDVPISIGTVKPNETPTAQKGTRPVPKAPTSQPATVSSDTTSPMTPAKSPGDASKAFPFQFGSISPGFMNGMQIPARTSSAPPNLDEQKRDQARHDALRSVPPLPTPAPKQQLPRKDVGAVEQSSIGDAYPVPKAKKDVQVSTATPVSQTQKSSVLPLPMSSVQMPFAQPPVSVQFGGPNPQIGVTPSSLQVPMPMAALPMGNGPQVQQPMYVQGLQSHPLQPQGIMHQGQALSFAPQMGPQLPPQLGNLGIGIASQYPQQQGGKFGGPRKTTVKITDPKTHEELRLDKRTDTYADGGSSGLRSHPNIPTQSQPIPSFAPTHPINYYPNSYNPSNLFFQSSSSLPLASGQIAPNSQPPRFNYSVGQGLPAVSFVNPSALNPFPVNKPGTSVHGVPEPSNSENVRDAHNVISNSSGAVQVKVKPAASSITEKVVDATSLNSSSAIEKGGSNKLSRPIVEANSSNLGDSENVPESALQHSKTGSESSASNPLPVAPKESVTIISDVSKAKETLGRSNSIKDHQKKVEKKGYIQLPHQIGGQPSSGSNLPSYYSGISDSVESKTTPTSSSVVSQGLTEPIPTISPSTSDVSEAKIDDSCNVSTVVPSEIDGSQGIVDTIDVAHQAKIDNSPQEQLECGTSVTERQGEEGFPQSPKQDDDSSQISSEPIISNSADFINQNKMESALTGPALGDEVPTLETMQESQEPVTCHLESDRMSESMDVSTSRNLESADAECDTLTDVCSNKSYNVGDKEVSFTASSALNPNFAPVPTPDISEASSKQEEEVVENSGTGSVSLAISSSKYKSAELTGSKSTTTRPKKKRKEIFQKADAAGTTSDLYMAYKGPEEKKESVVCSEVTENTSISSNLKQAPADALQVESRTSEKGVQNKAEPDDWEDAADISTPKLETPDNVGQRPDGLVLHGYIMNSNMAKKYSRDFLLKFSGQCTVLPESFEITPDIVEALMSVGASHFVERDTYPSPGRVVDRSNSGSWMDRRGGGMVDDDRWNKLPGHFGMGRELRVDVGFGVNAGFRPVQGGNYGVLRNPRSQAPAQYAGGILSGPSQTIGSQGGMQRNSPDADRWQRATNFQQKGLIPSPQTPVVVMHKAEKKYEVGKVADVEEAKQRQLKAILNKLTPQNFEKLFEQVKAVNIDNTVTLNGVISQIFDKALMEPTFCEMYANFCYHLAGELPGFTENDEKINFKRLLLNKCQEEFERGEREEEEANKVDEEGEPKQSEEQREEKRVKAKRRMLGNIRLIGELYKKKMLTERIMHECINKLLGHYQNPDEEDVEALCKLMSTIGEMIDRPKAKEPLDAYFDRMAKLSNNMKLSSRVRFMLKDAIDLRKNKWQQRRKVEGPKKIEEVHRDAAQERHHQSSRLARNPSLNPSNRRTPMDFGTRGSAMLSSPNAQMGVFHGLPAQVRGYGTQDIRFEERQSYEARTLSVPLPRSLGDDSITLGPQGGLARGMSIRGPPAMADVSPSPGDSRRMSAALNGFSTVSDRPAYSPREDFIPRYAQDRFAVPAVSDQSSVSERNVNYVNWDPRNQDRSFDRSLATSQPGHTQGPPYTQNIASEKGLSEECLQDKSMAAIKEFYSIRDEKEVALCIKELNSSSFHPSLISLWVTDSFERKDMERNLLAKLLVNLAKSQDSILTPSQLIKGFESVLTTLEDAVNDAPKAAEFLGCIFAKVVLENVVSLREIGQLLYEGGEKRGSLLEVGLAGDVLGSTLEMIKADKGESVLKEIRISSNLHLEDFRPPDPNRSTILENFI